MLLIVCAALHFGMVKAGNDIDNTTVRTTEDYRKNEAYFTTKPLTNPVKKIFQDMDGRMKRLGLNKGSESLVYNAGPYLYDYPEVWWTTTTAMTMNAMTTTTKEKPVITTTNIYHRAPDTTLSNKQRDHTSKPLKSSNNISKPNVVLKNINKAEFKELVKRQGGIKKIKIIKRKKLSTTTARDEKEDLSYVFVIDRDDKGGDISIEANDTNMAIELRKNSGIGVHAKVTSAMLIDKEMATGDFEYLFHIDNKGNRSKNVSPETLYEDLVDANENDKVMLIKVLKSEETSKGLQLFQQGEKVMIGPDATGHLGKDLKKLLYNKYKVTEKATRKIQYTSRIGRAPYPIQQINQRFPRNPMNRNPNYNNNLYYKNPFKRNPNFMGNRVQPGNFIGGPYQNQYNNRNPFQQNGRIIRGYQHNNFLRNPFNQNPFVSRNQFNQNPMNYNRNQFGANANFNNPNYNGNPNQHWFGSLNQDPGPNQNAFNQNQYKQYHPYFSGNQFNYVNGQPAFGMTNDPSFASNIPYGYPNMVRQMEITTQATEVTNATETTATETVEPTTAKSLGADPHVDPEAFLPTVNSTELGDIPGMPESVLHPDDNKTTITTTTTTETTTIHILPPKPSTIMITMKGGKGPGTAPPVFLKPPAKISPFIQEIYDLKKEINTGFFSAIMIALFDSLADKSPKDAHALFRKVDAEFRKMEQIDRIMELGRPIYDGLSALNDRISGAPTDYLLASCKILHHAMFTRKQTMSKDINSIIDYIDKIFIEEEAIPLMKAVEKIHCYPNVSSTPEQILREFTTTLFHPTILYHGTAKERILLDSLNQLIFNHMNGPLPSRRRSNTNLKITEEQLKDANRIIERFTAFESLNNAKAVKKLKTIKNPGKTNNNLMRKNVNDTSLIGFRPVAYKQQRYKIKGNKMRSVPKFYNDTVKTKATTAVPTSESRDITKEEKSRERNKKNHNRKKISLKKLKELKKYLKKKTRHGQKRRRKKSHKSHKRHGRHKLSKTKKMLLKYKVVAREYQRLLNLYTKYTHEKSTTESLDKLPVTNKRTLFKSSYQPHSIARLNNWVPLKVSGAPHFSPTTSAAHVNEIRNPSNTDLLSKFNNFKAHTKANPQMYNQNFFTNTYAYNDDEERIKYNIQDAMQHEYRYINARRHGKAEKTHKINQPSSYSSEETILKSKIYKGLIFNDSFAINDHETIKIDDRQAFKNGVKRYVSRRSNVRPINNVDTSYNDDEEIIRDRLNI